MCEDSCSDPLWDSQRPSQENSRASPPPPTTGASNRARISPPLKHGKVNTHRNLPDSEEMGVFMPTGKGETHMTAQRNYSPFTAPSRPDPARGHGAGVLPQLRCITPSDRSPGRSPSIPDPTYWRGEHRRGPAPAVSTAPRASGAQQPLEN